MRRRVISFCWAIFLLSACFRNHELAIVHGPSAKKQRQKIAVLQKKLKLAEKEQGKVQSEVERIHSEIHAVQLSLIRRQIDEAENKKEPYDFLEEREMLYRIIQGGLSPSAFEAQVELDRILRIITEMSDKGSND